MPDEVYLKLKHLANPYGDGAQLTSDEDELNSVKIIYTREDVVQTLSRM